MTVDNLVVPETDWHDGLPPDEYWAIDPGKKIPTPVDSRGLIVVRELIESAKAYVCPEYRWDGPNDKHHLYYFASTYKTIEDSTDGLISAHRFRELAVNKILIPRRFHNVIHKVILPANIPSPDVMRKYIDAWTVARSLFSTVRRAVRAERNAKHRKGDGVVAALSEPDKVDEEIMSEVSRRHFAEISRHIGALSLVPEEFRPVEPGTSILDSVSRLGSVLAHGRQVWIREVLLPDPNKAPCNCLRCKLNSSIITPVNN